VMNRKRILFLYSTITCLLILIVGCKKYEEGPALSIYSKKARVVGKWEFEINPESNGTDWLDNSGNFTPYVGDNVEFTKEMKVKWNDVDYGTWKFDADKEYIVVNNGTNDRYWFIIKLKNNNLWVHYELVTSSGVWEWHFKRLK